MSAFSVGEWVLLTSQKGKKWLVRVEETPYYTHLGNIDMTDIVGKEEGEFLETNKGAKLFLFRPTLEEYIYSMERQTQIIYPKDLGALVFYGDIAPGHLILESGLGSGGLSLALLRALGGQGRLISVEKRPEFASLAMSNIEKYFGYRPQNHEIVVGNIEDFHMNAKADRVFLDLPEPWHAVKNIAKLIHYGGLVLSLSPNVGQIQLMYRELKAHGFANITTFELMKRDWMLDERRARPTDRMIAHTGFITVAKRTPKAFLEGKAASAPEPESEPTGE